MIKILVNGQVVMSERLSLTTMLFIMNCIKDSSYAFQIDQTNCKHYESFTFISEENTGNLEVGDTCTVAIFHRDLHK